MVSPANGWYVGKIHAADGTASYSDSVDLNVPVDTGYRVFVYYRATSGDPWGIYGYSSGTVDVIAAGFNAITVTAPTGTGSQAQGSSLPVTWTTNQTVASGEFSVWVVSPGNGWYVGKIHAADGTASYSDSVALNVPVDTGYRIYVYYRAISGDPWGIYGYSTGTVNVAAALSPNLLPTPGTQVSSFDTDVASWAVNLGTATADAVHYREGTGALRLQPTAAGGTVTVEKSLASLDMSSGRIRLWVYLDADPATVSAVKLQVSPVTNPGITYSMGRYFMWTGSASSLKKGWNLFTLAQSDFTSTASGGISPSWSEPMLRARIQLVGASGQRPTASFDDLRCGVVAQPVVLLSFKNGTSGQYANAAPVLGAAGFPGTAFIDSGDVDKTGQMTLAQLQEIYAAGWDVGNHSDSSAQLTSMTLAEARAALTQCETYLENNGMPRAARQVAYVDGQYNDTVLQAMHDTGMQSGTTITALSIHTLQALPMDNPFVIPSWDAGLLINGTGSIPAGGVAAVEARIDEAIAKGAPIELIFHDVSAAGTTSSGYTVSKDDLATICAYLKQLGVPVVTISKLYSLNSDSTMLVQNDRWAPTTTARTDADLGGGRIVSLDAVDNVSGVKTITYNLNGAGETPYVAPFTVPSGPHTLSYHSVDNAGNSETPVVMTDFQPPVTTCSGSEGAWVSGTGSLTLSATDLLSGGSLIKEIVYSIDGGSTWRSAVGSSASVTVPTEGPATLVYHAVDAAGNVEADNTMHFLVDNVAPTSTLLGVDTLPHNAPVTLTLSAMDAAIGSYAYGSNVASISYSIDGAAAVTTPGLGPLAVTLGEGDHHVAYWSTDNAGNIEAARTVYMRVAAPLPPNLIKDPGTQISSFDNASDWTRVGSAGTVAANTTQVKEGSGSLQLSTGNPSTTVTAQKSLGSGLDMSSMLNGLAIRFWVYVHSDPTVSGFTFRLRLSPDADGSFTNQFVWATNRTAIHPGWNFISLAKEDFTRRFMGNSPAGVPTYVGQDPAGNPSWSQPMRWARVEVSAPSTQAASVSFDDLRFAVRATPAVVMSFDDADATVYQDAFPVMAARGMVGTSYVITDQVDNPDNPETMTTAQLQSLYAAGWDLGNHTLTHANLTTLSLAAAEQELSGAAAFLTNNAMPRGARFVAYPGGTVNSTVLQAMADTGMLTGRITSYRPLGLPIDDPYQLPGSTTAVATLTLDQIKTRIDQAVTAGATINLIFHTFGDPNLDPTYIQSVQEFTAICDYISQRGIPTMTISQFYAHSQWGPSNDTTAPVTTADYNGSWHTSPLTIHFTATDSGSGVDYTQYSLDGGAHWTNGNAVTIAGPSASIVSFRSADQAGNLEQTKTVPPLQIDPTAPTATATASPSGWTTGNVSVTLSASDAASGLDTASATCSVDGVPQSFTYGNPVSITTPGDHTVVFTIKDVAGNTATAQVHALIDRTAPTATATASPATWTNGNVAVSLGATDGQSGVDTSSATYSIDGGAAQALAWGTPVSVTTVGTHTVSFTVKDMLGNAATASAQARIERTAPVTTVNFSSTAWQKSNVILTFTPTDSGGSGVSSTQSSVDGTTWTNGTSRTISTDGQWTVLYRSVDAAGNVETPNNSVLVKMDKTPPTITIAAPQVNATYLRNQVVLASWTATDAGSGMSSSSSSPVANGIAIDTATFGAHSFSVTADDIAGNSITASANSYTVPFASTTGIVGVNANGSSTFTRPATIPLSFQLTTSSGGWYTYTTGSRPHLYLARQTGGTWGAEQAAVKNPPATPDANGFAYSSTTHNYTFNNLATTGLTAGVWRLRVDLGGGGAMYAQFTLN